MKHLLQPKNNLPIWQTKSSFIKTIQIISLWVAGVISGCGWWSSSWSQKSPSSIPVSSSSLASSSQRNQSSISSSVNSSESSNIIVIDSMKKVIPQNTSESITSYKFHTNISWVSFQHHGSNHENIYFLKNNLPEKYSLYDLENSSFLKDDFIELYINSNWVWFGESFSWKIEITWFSNQQEQKISLPYEYIVWTSLNINIIDGKHNFPITNTQEYIPFQIDKQLFHIPQKRFEYEILSPSNIILSFPSISVYNMNFIHTLYIQDKSSPTKYQELTQVDSFGIYTTPNSNTVLHDCLTSISSDGSVQLHCEYKEPFPLNEQIIIISRFTWTPIATSAIRLLWTDIKNTSSSSISSKSESSSSTSDIWFSASSSVSSVSSSNIPSSSSASSSFSLSNSTSSISSSSNSMTFSSVASTSIASSIANIISSSSIAHTSSSTSSISLSSLESSSVSSSSVNNSSISSSEWSSSSSDTINTAQSELLVTYNNNQPSKFNSANYTARSWLLYLEAIENAKNTLDMPTPVAESKYKNALFFLNYALSEREKHDLSEINITLRSVENYSQLWNYNVNAWSLFQTVQQAALDIRTDGTQKEIDTANNNLKYVKNILDTSPSQNYTKFLWNLPTKRENCDRLIPIELWGYEIRYKKPSDVQFTYININEYAGLQSVFLLPIEINTNTDIVEIAAYDTNMLYSKYVPILSSDSQNNDNSCAQ